MNKTGEVFEGTIGGVGEFKGTFQKAEPAKEAQESKRPAPSPNTEAKGYEFFKGDGSVFKGTIRNSKERLRQIRKRISESYYTRTAPS